MNIDLCSFSGQGNTINTKAYRSHKEPVKPVIFAGFKSGLKNDTVSFSGARDKLFNSNISFGGNFFYDRIKADTSLFKQVVAFNDDLGNLFANNPDEASLNKIVKEHFPDLALKITNCPDAKDLKCHTTQYYHRGDIPESFSRIYINTNNVSPDNVFDAVLSVEVHKRINELTENFIQQLKIIAITKNLNKYTVQQLINKIVPDKEIYIEDYSAIPERINRQYIEALTDNEYGYKGIHKRSTIYVDFNVPLNELVTLLAHEFCHAMQAISLQDIKFKMYASSKGLDIDKCDKAFRYMVNECFYHREITDINEIVRESLGKFNIADNKVSREMFINLAQNEAQAYMHQYKQEKSNPNHNKEHLEGVMTQLRFMENLVISLTENLYPQLVGKR